MKKRFLSALLCGILVTGMLASASALEVYIDGEPLKSEVSAQLINNRTMVPIGPIFTQLGATVTWNGTTRTAIGEKGDTQVVIQINSSVAYVNGEAVALDTPAMIIDDRTMVPAAFVSTALGAKVYWDGESSTVRIATKVYEVLQVVDGTTAVVDVDGTEETVCLIGVKVPDGAETQAADYTREHLEGKQVELELDSLQRDQSGRLLAYLWVDGAMFNKSLLKDGVAQLSVSSPNVKYEKELAAAADTAAGQQTQDQAGTGAVKTTGAYVGSLESDKYHLPGCRFAEKILPENMIWFDTLPEAEHMGYQPCGVCHPDA